MNLARAIVIAAQAHENQLRVDGTPYILHPLRVMEAMSTDEEKVVAVLHDVLEDTSTTLDELRTAGLTAREERALIFLTHHPAQPYMEYVRVLAQDPLAKAVKIEDIKDNYIHLDAVKAVDEERYTRLLAKYEAAAIHLGRPGLFIRGRVDV